MKQILQNLKTGKTEISNVPKPSKKSGSLLIKSRNSLISAGTERTLVEFGKSSLINKAKSQPEKVFQVINKIKTDGLAPTLEAVFNRLDEPLPLGYCNAGIVLDTSAYKNEFIKGDRVVSNGAHAEVVSVPYNLCAKIPDFVTDEQASFTVLASIGLQGLRLAEPTLNDKFVVYGLGLIGLVTVQLLKANGCEVLGVDFNPSRLRLAEKFGAKTVDIGQADPLTAAMSWSGGKGVDGVLITASAKSDDIVHHAAQMCRKRGRIVLVGVVGLNLKRADFYEKELSFQVSCSYGPGRYDEKYEQEGQDYPYGFVRWTEQRNFEAVLQLMSLGKLTVDDLITHRIPFDNASEAYDIITQDPDALGVILQYPEQVDMATTIEIPTIKNVRKGTAVVGIIGAGNFSKMTLMPALNKTSARLAYISDLKGDSARYVANKFSVEKATTDYKVILADPDVQAVLIAVGHNLHSRLVCEVLEAGKHVFVEKPLAMKVEELKTIVSTLKHPNDLSLMVGFNRRFSPHTLKIMELLKGRTEPLAMNMTVNAGIIPPGHWVHDPVRGGGRIIGEACHFIDLMVFLCGSPVVSVSSHRMGGNAVIPEDKMSISLDFADGSIGTVNYFANGSKSYPKETLEVFSEGRVVRLENFRRTTGFGFKGFRKFTTWRQDKGHVGQFASFVRNIEQGGAPLIPIFDLINVTLASFAAMTSSRESRMVHIEKDYGPFFSQVQ